MDMGLVTMAVNFNNAKVFNDVSTAMLAKALDINRDYGQGIVELLDSATMERSVNPSVGSNIDISL